MAVRRSCVFCLHICVLFASCNLPCVYTQATLVIPTWNISVIKTIPHDPNFFTEGLFIQSDVFYESVAEPSQLVSYTLYGDMLHQQSVEANPFAEGISAIGDQLYQLSWKAGTAYMFEFDTFMTTGSAVEIGRRSYNGQGWGMCNNGQYFVMSNGTEWLQFRDLRTFDVLLAVINF